MTHSIPIGLIAGLLSALLFASASKGSLLAFMVFYLAALPGFIAALGWGMQAAFLTLATSVFVIFILLGMKHGFAFFLTIALPVFVLSFLALLNRQSSPSEPEKTAPDANITKSNETHLLSHQAGREWYPVDRILAWATLMAAALTGLSVLLIGSDFESYKMTLETLLREAVIKNIEAQTSRIFSPREIENFILILIYALPFISAILWLTVTLGNMWTAGKIVEISGRLPRPWPDMSRLDLPPSFRLLSACFLPGLLLPGLLGVIATGVIGAFFFAYLMIGLAIIHKLTEPLSYRPWLLAILYFAIFLLGWVALIVVFIAIGDPFFKFRENQMGGRTPPSGHP